MRTKHDTYPTSSHRIQFIDRGKILKHAYSNTCLIKLIWAHNAGVSREYEWDAALKYILKITWEVNA